MTQQTTDPQTGNRPTNRPTNQPGKRRCPAGTIRPRADPTRAGTARKPQRNGGTRHRAAPGNPGYGNAGEAAQGRTPEVGPGDHRAFRQPPNYSSRKMKTGETVYLEKSTYTSLVADANGNHNAAHQALIDYGPQWLVKDKVDSSSLSAWVREQRRDEIEIHEDLIPFLKISDVYRVKVRL